MITITVLLDNQVIVGYEVTGHSRYAVHGSDIVCAGVSALSQTALPALSQLLDLSPDWFRQDGFLSCRLPEGLDAGQINTAQIVFKTLLIGLEIISSEYPKNVRIINKEV